MRFVFDWWDWIIVECVVVLFVEVVESFWDKDLNIKFD